MASESFRAWAADSPRIRAIAYDTLEEFEQRVETEILALLGAVLERAIPPLAIAALPQVPRGAACDALARAAAGRRPTLVTGTRGSGISWLARRWAESDPRGLYIDGRQLGERDLGGLLQGAPQPDGRALPGIDAAALTQALLQRLSVPHGTPRVVLDHFEDGFAAASRGDLSWLPCRLPRGAGVVVVTYDRRLQEQASALDWQVHGVEEMAAEEARGFVASYLEQYAKRLSSQQEAALSRAPWFRNFASLVLALDELRRYGTFETLDQRIAEVARAGIGAGLVDEVVKGPVSVVPEPWKGAVEDALIARASASAASTRRKSGRRRPPPRCLPICGPRSASAPPADAAALLVVPSLVTNLWQLFAGRSLARLAGRLAGMMAGAVVGTLLTADVLVSATAGMAGTALGIALLAYAAVGLSGLQLAVPRRCEPWLSPVVGLTTGLVTGGTGVFVLPAVPYLQAIGLDRDDLVQALGLSFTVSTLALAAGLLRGRLLAAGAAGMSLLALVPALAGMMLGQAVRRRLAPRAFRTVFFAGLLLLGAYLAVGRVVL